MKRPPHFPPRKPNPNNEVPPVNETPRTLGELREYTENTGLSQAQFKSFMKAAVERHSIESLETQCPGCAMPKASNEQYCPDCHYEQMDTYHDAGYPMEKPVKPEGYDERLPKRKKTN